MARMSENPASARRVKQHCDCAASMLASFWPDDICRREVLSSGNRATKDSGAANKHRAEAKRASAGIGEHGQLCVTWRRPSSLRLPTEDAPGRDSGTARRPGRALPGLLGWELHARDAVSHRRREALGRQRGLASCARPCLCEFQTLSHGNPPLLLRPREPSVHGCLFFFGAVPIRGPRRRLGPPLLCRGATPLGDRAREVGLYPSPAISLGLASWLRPASKRKSPTAATAS